MLHSCSVCHRCFRHRSIQKATNKASVERVSHFSTVEQPDWQYGKDMSVMWSLILVRRLAAQSSLAPAPLEQSFTMCKKLARLYSSTCNNPTPARDRRQERWSELVAMNVDVDTYRSELLCSPCE
jgi:hypothetical protein